MTYASVQIVTEVLRRSLPNPDETIVVPAIGNTDVFPYGQMGKGPNHQLDLLLALWGKVLPRDSVSRDDFERGGYHVREINEHLNVIAVNTLFWSTTNKLATDCSDPQSPGHAQFEWLRGRLSEAASKRKVVYLTGHTPPGPQYKPACLKQYRDMAELYARVVLGHFYSGNHTDEFRVLRANAFDENDENEVREPVAVVFSAPSLVPTYNPAIRVYRYETATHVPLSYTQYYADIEQANRRAASLDIKRKANQARLARRRHHNKTVSPEEEESEAEIEATLLSSLDFVKEYRSSEAYPGMHDLMPHTWLELEKRLAVDMPTLRRYHQFRDVSTGSVVYRPPTDPPRPPSMNSQQPGSSEEDEEDEEDDEEEDSGGSSASSSSRSDEPADTLDRYIVHESPPVEPHVGGQVASSSSSASAASSSSEDSAAQGFAASPLHMPQQQQPLPHNGARPPPHAPPPFTKSPGQNPSPAARLQQPASSHAPARRRR